MTNHCPFCGNYAYNVSVGDAYQMDCRYCEIQVEITKRAYGARCPDPVAVLDYIREKMKNSTRPRVDLADMKRTRQPIAPQPTPTDIESDVLTTAAKAIGTTLGKIAVKAGIAKPPAAAPQARKRVPAKPRTRKAPAAKRQAPAAKRQAPAAKRKAPAAKGAAVGKSKPAPTKASRRKRTK